MAEKQTNTDRMREIVDSIENGIKELFESDKYRQYLFIMSRFHRYSVNNTMLIYMQRPDATHVAGFNMYVSVANCLIREVTKFLGQYQAFYRIYRTLELIAFL